MDGKQFSYREDHLKYCYTYVGQDNFKSLMERANSGAGVVAQQ